MPGSQLLQAKNRQIGGARAALVPAPSTSLRIGINHGQIRTWTCWWVWLMGGHGQELEPCPTMALLRLAWSPGSHFSSFFFFFNTLNPSWSLSLSEASKSCVSWKQIKLFITVTGGFFPAFVWTEEMMLPFRHSDRAAIQEVKLICHPGDFILSVLKCPPSAALFLLRTEMCHSWFFGSSVSLSLAWDSYKYFSQLDASANCFTLFDMCFVLGCF